MAALPAVLLETPMVRGAWRATVHGVGGARHDLATKPPPPPDHFSSRIFGPLIQSYEPQFSQ